MTAVLVILVCIIGFSGWQFIRHFKPPTRNQTKPSRWVEPIETPRYPFSLLVDELPPEQAPYPYNAIYIRYRDDCIRALQGLESEIVKVHGEVHISYTPGSSGNNLKVRLLDIDEPLQKRIIDVLPKQLDRDYDPSRYPLRLGPRGGKYLINSKGKRVYLKR